MSTERNRQPIEEDAPIVRGREPVEDLVVPAGVCRTLTNPVDYAVFVHFCLAFEEQARNWGAPAHTTEDLWRRMTTAGLQNASGALITYEGTVASLRRLQDAGLVRVGGGDSQ